jgi:hypothetical protein
MLLEEAKNKKFGRFYREKRLWGHLNHFLLTSIGGIGYVKQWVAIG